MTLNKDMSLINRINILSEVSTGLKCLHDNNIAHVDLKMDNIMKFENIFKLIDLESSIDFNKTINDKYEIKSTLEIMAPEIYSLNYENINTSCDIWSLGVIF